MNAQENIRVVKRVYEHFKSGDVAGLLAFFSTDIELQMPTIENVSFSGTHRGLEAAARFFQMIGEAQQVLEFEPQAFIAQDDKVAVQGTALYRVKATGREYANEWVHVVTVRDGKITASKEYLDTAASAAAFQPTSTSGK